MEDFFIANFANFNPSKVTYLEHLKRNLKLAVPVMITQAGQITVNLVDNFMVGGLGGRFDYVVDEQLGKTALGAVSLGNSVFMMALVVAFGFSFAISPLVAAADARKNKKEAGQIFAHGFLLNMILAVLMLSILELFCPLLYKMGQPKDVIDMSIPFLRIMAWSMIPIMIFQTFRQFSEGLSLTLSVTIATIVGNIVNIVMNYGLIFGYLGMPRMEVTGAGWGTFIARISMMLMMLLMLFTYKKTKSYMAYVRFRKFQINIFRQLIKLGIPTAMTAFFEIFAFAGAAFVSGYALSESMEDIQSAKTNLAAHQIAISLASATFMMCLGLSVAATVRVGYQLGLKDYKTLRSAGLSTIFMAAAFMLICGVLMVTFRYDLPYLYLDNPEVIALAGQLLIIASLFQLSDGIQQVTLGALRGMQDVVIPSVITFVSYLIIALPLGILLAIHFKMQAIGMWIGLLCGLTISAIMLFLRYQKQTKKLIYENTRIPACR